MHRTAKNGPPKSAVPDRLLTVHEAAYILGFKVATIYQWISDRKIHYVKIGKKSVRIRLSVVQELMASSDRPALA